jgi:hypothetical protein
MGVSASNLDRRARSEVVAGERAWIVLVMDNTGSMYDPPSSPTKIAAMKSAARELVEILYGERDEIRDSSGRNIFWVGLVPYTSAVNIGPERVGWLANPAAAASPFGAATGTPVPAWRGCVEAEGGTRDRTEEVTAGTLSPYLFPSLSKINPPDEAAQEHSTKRSTRRRRQHQDHKGVGPNSAAGRPDADAALEAQRAERSTLDSGIAAAPPPPLACLGMAHAFRALARHVADRKRPRLASDGCRSIRHPPDRKVASSRRWR